MDNTVILGAHVEVAYAKLLTITLKCLHLLTSHGVVDYFLLIGGRIMVRHSYHLLRAKYLDALIP